MENLHEDNKPSSHFYILIPSEVITNSKLTDGAKLLYGEILFLSTQNGYCFATNDYFGKLNSVSKRTINNWLTELRIAGLIRSEVIRNSYNRQVEKRKIFITKDFSVTKMLNSKRQKGTYKTNTTAVKETGVDEVSQTTLDSVPF